MPKYNLVRCADSIPNQTALIVAFWMILAAVAAAFPTLSLASRRSTTYFYRCRPSREPCPRTATAFGIRAIPAEILLRHVTNLAPRTPQIDISHAVCRTIHHGRAQTRTRRVRSSKAALDTKGSVERRAGTLLLADKRRREAAMPEIVYKTTSRSMFFPLSPCHVFLRYPFSALQLSLRRIACRQDSLKA